MDGGATKGDLHLVISSEIIFSLLKEELERNGPLGLDFQTRTCKIKYRNKGSFGLLMSITYQIFDRASIVFPKSKYHSGNQQVDFSLKIRINSQT